jgi:pimeloyl-ACP methyl ester carboxylesterase
MGRLVTVSLGSGLIAAVAVAAAPFVPVEESALTGAVLSGFAVGWVVLWLLSIRRTDQPQRWAAVPASYMGAAGLLLVDGGSPVREAFTWVWPPTLLALAVWMWRRTRRDMSSRGGRIQVYVVSAVLTATAVGGGYEAIGEATDATGTPSTGRLVDVGGHLLYISCVGSGSPTVVLEPGAGGTSAQMGWITPDVAARTRVCVYDRAGRGWSEPAATAQDGAQIAIDLHTLLHNAGEPGPYVLAGHSFGGLYVRTFAQHYPDEVVGLVLVDTTAAQEPATSVAPPERRADDGVGRVASVSSIAGRVGVARLLAQTDWAELPPQSQTEIRTSNAQAGWFGSTVDEYLRAGPSAREAAVFRDFGDKPLFVVTAGRHPQSWMTEQSKLLALSTNSTQEIVEGAAHIDLLVTKGYAAETADAIIAVVESARTGRTLRG